MKTSTVQCFVAILAGAGAIGLAAPAAAAENAPAAQTNSQAASPATADRGRTICVRVEMTGTRVARRVCRTAAEWEAEGGVPDGR